MNPENKNQINQYCPVYKSLGLYEDMAGIKKIERRITNIKRRIVISLYTGDDLVPLVKKVCLEEGIRGAFVSSIGAADRIPIASFNIKTGKYDEIIKTGYHEITSVSGNVSTILDDENNAIDLMIHLHISFADTNGNSFGGHLLPGYSSIAVGEVYIDEVEGGMYRYQSEIDKSGYSTIKLNIPLNKDLIPVCRDEMGTYISGNEILTLKDAINIKESGYTKVEIEKISNMTSEAGDYLIKNNIKISIIVE